MNYNPAIAFELKFTPMETLAYQLCAFFIKLRNEKFPNYRHGRTVTDVKKLKQSIMFKHFIKFINENSKRFDEFQMLLFIRSQFEIMKKLQDDGKKPLIDINMIHGEAANKRWYVWKKLIAEKTAVKQLTYTFVESNLVYEFEKTKKVINNILEGNFEIELFAKKGSTILKHAILREISPIYVVLSNWIKKLPEQIVIDLSDICSIDKYKDYDMSKAEKIYQKYFPHEINM